jgi:hypothetical protein
MDGMQLALMFLLIWIGIIARILVLIRYAMSGLFPVYPFFAALVLVSLARSAVAVMLVHSYARFYQVTQWPIAILEALAVIEAFWLLARHFRKMRGFGWTVLGVIAAVSWLSIGAATFLRAGWNGPLTPLILFGMYTHIALLTAALLCLAFFKQFRDVPIRPNAKRHLFVLALFFATYFLATFVAQIVTQAWQSAPNFLISSGAILAFGRWVLVMNREGERLPFDARPEMSEAEFVAAEAQYERSGIDLQRAADEAMRKSLRP